MIRTMISILIIFSILIIKTYAKELLDIQGINFELAVSSYKYLAVLFYDESPYGLEISRQWEEAVTSIEDMPSDSEVGQISSRDSAMAELMESYDLTLPVIRVFRNGIMAEYRGPLDSDGMARYLVEDAMPSVKYIQTVLDMKKVMETNLNTVLFGMFPEDDIIDHSNVAEGYSIDAWGQFQASADSLRGHATFFAVTSKDVIDNFNLSEEDLPAIYMMVGDNEGFLKYTGEILEINLSEWVLRNADPTMGELSVTTHSGELYATQFFSSRKLKFILFIHPSMMHSDVLDSWQDISDTFAGKAIFSYMTTPVADVLEYFSIDLDRDIPIIAAHQPVNDFRYKSKRFDSVEDRDDMLEFVAGVVQGVVPKIIRSEPIPTTNTAATGSTGIAVAVGKSVVDMVSNEEKDVLLAVYTPYCPQCKRLFPSYQLLARAVQGESRILIAKINAAANDVPASWGIKNYPTLLWFPAKDKPYNDGNKKSLPIPRQYWDAGYSTQEMLRFVQREGSFEVESLRVATSEQLGSLLVEEEAIRAQYDEDERHYRRNEDREIFEDQMVDYLIGEVVFDGKRWHYVLLGVLVVINIGLLFYILVTNLLQGSKGKVVVKKKKSS